MFVDIFAFMFALPFASNYALSKQNMYYLAKKQYLCFAFRKQ